MFRILMLLTSVNVALGVDFPLRWRWSNPMPHGGNVVDMAFSPTLGLTVQVAERGQIYTSSDLDIWLPRDSNTTMALRAVCFLGQRIIITGENGTVLYADNISQFLPGTLASGPTTAWLEAAAASGTLAVAAGDYGEIYTSTNGAIWYRQTSGVTTWFRGAAYGNGTFVVVGENGGILTSPNGTNWIVRASPTTKHLNRVNFGLQRFTAVADAGVSIASTNNGASWFTEVTGATNSLQCAVTGGMDRLVDGVHEVRLHHDLVWSDQLKQPNGPPDWTYYTAVGLPGFFLIAGQTGLQSEGYSSTNYYWLTPYNSVRNWMWDVKRLPSFYVGVGDFGSIMTSGNGVDWTLELVPLAATNTTFLGVGGTTNLLLAAGEGGTMLYSPNILSNIVVTNATGVVTQTVSSLGVIWHPVPSFTANDLQGVGVLSNSLFVVSGGQGSLFASQNGTNWAPRTSGTTNLLSSITDWPGGLVASGDRGTLLASADGLTWTKVAMTTTNWLYRVRWLNGNLVAVGQAGTIFSSADGTNWFNRVSGVTTWLTDASYVGDTWFAVGLSGTVLSSSNLVNWVNRGTITKKALYAAATDGAQLVTVGVEGVILRSQVVPDLTPVSILNFSRVATNGTPPYYNVYLFGGKPDQRFTADRATNVVSAAWTTGPLLEIFDGSGSLYYVEIVYGTNQPTTEFYRTSLDP